MGNEAGGPDTLKQDKNFILFFLYIFFIFGGLKCVGHSLDYVSHFVFLKHVWIRTQIVAVASRCATNLATHLHKFKHNYLHLWKKSRENDSDVADEFAKYLDNFKCLNVYFFEKQLKPKQTIYNF